MNWLEAPNAWRNTFRAAAATLNRIAQGSGVEPSATDEKYARQAGAMVLRG